MSDEKDDEQDDEDMSAKQVSNSKSKPWLFQKGQSGNPSGRPKGSKSLKEYAKEMLASMTDEERQDFMHGLPKEVIWKLAEGNPANNTDITSGGKPIVQLAQEIIEKNEITPSTEPDRQGSTQV